MLHHKVLGLVKKSRHKRLTPHYCFPNILIHNKTGPMENSVGPDIIALAGAIYRIFKSAMRFL